MCINVITKGMSGKWTHHALTPSLYAFESIYRRCAPPRQNQTSPSLPSQRQIRWRNPYVLDLLRLIWSRIPNHRLVGI
ncbi:Uncharacterised protein [Vibrio cholerae]|nr:Uncharacterised protein [Vibrio cholerae]